MWVAQSQEESLALVMDSWLRRERGHSCSSSNTGSQIPGHSGQVVMDTGNISMPKI